MSTKGPSKQSRSRRPLSAISTTRSNQLFRPRMFSIAVQPPSQARARRTLYPPIIAKGRAASTTTEADVYFMFATAVLRDAEGNLLTEVLAGTLSASGMFLEERRAGNVVFMFPDLVVPDSGAYSVRVDIYKVDSTGQGAVLVDQTETQTFEVYDSDVPSERPCKSAPENRPPPGLCWDLGPVGAVSVELTHVLAPEERSVIRKLRDQGHRVPSGPR